MTDCVTTNSSRSRSNQPTCTSNNVINDTSLPRLQQPNYQHLNSNYDATISNDHTQNLPQSHCLSIGFLNVCGLRRRLEYPDFTDVLLKYDIICFAETKLDYTDVISCEGYTFFNKPRKERYLRKSGGIEFLVRNDLCRHVTFIDPDNEYVAWLKIRKTFQHQNDDIIVGSVYIPPQRSQFFTADEYEGFEREVTSVCGSYDSVYLMGDFNAQTGTLEDFTSPDDFFCRIFLILMNLRLNFMTKSVRWKGLVFNLGVSQKTQRKIIAV